MAVPAAGSPTSEPRGSAASRIGRGAVRLLASLDYRTLTEFPLPDGRRADIAAIDPRGVFAIVEIKSSVADFRADAKWRHYGAFCDGFYFAVDPRFPWALLPEDVGIIVADAWSGAVLRPAVPASLNPARRRALLLRFARTASARLSVLGDPGLAWAGPEW